MIVVPRQVVRQAIKRADEFSERIIDGSFRLGCGGLRRHRHFYVRAIRELHTGWQNHDAAFHYPRVAHDATVPVRAAARK